MSNDWDAVRCTDCGALLVDVGEVDLDRAQMDAVLAHLENCPERAERFKRIRRNQEPGWWAGSYTSLSKYDRCPAAYKYQQDSRFRATGDKALLGRGLHADGAGESAGETPIALARKFLALRQQFENFLRVPDHAQREREWFIEWQVNDEVRAQIRCFLDTFWIDWAEMRAFNIDSKTGAWNNAEIREEWAVQRLMYALALEQNIPGLWSVTSWTHHLQSESIWPHPHGETFEPWQINDFFELLKQKVERIVNDRKFDPQLGPACKVCDFAEQCPAAQERLKGYTLELTTNKGKSTITIPQSLAKDKNFIADLDAARSQLRKLLSDADKASKAYRDAGEREDGAA